MTNRSPKRLALVAILLLAILAAACSNDDGDKSSSNGDKGGTDTSEFNEAQFEGTPREGGNITFGVESNIASLDPAGNLAQPSDVVTALAIYDTLLDYDTEGKLAPNLATEWSNTDDLKTYRVTLREGVTFGDGTPFNADAVIKHYQRLQDPATACSCIDRVAAITSMTALSPTEVEFQLAEPNAFFLNDIMGGVLGMIVSPAQVEKYGADYARHPMGTGAFILENYDSLVLKKNPSYWKKDDEGRQLPYLDQITIKPIPDARVRLQSLQSGDADIIQTADTGTIVDAVKAGNIKVQKVTGSSSTIILLNTSKPPFDDLRARQAVAHSINRDVINRIQYGGARQPGFGPFPPGSTFDNPDVDWPEYDMEKAKALIDELKADGKETSFTSVCIPTEESRKIVGLLQDQAKKIGVDQDTEFQDQGAYVQRIFSKSGDYQAGCFRSPQCATADCLYNSLHSEGSGNVVFYNDPETDAALEAIRATTDEKEQIRQVGIVQERLAANLPVINLLYDLFGNMYTDKISGLPVPEPWSLGAIEPATLYVKQ